MLEPGRTVMWCIEGELDLALDVFFSTLLTGRSSSFLSVCSPLVSSADGILKATGVRPDELLDENVPGDKPDSPVVVRDSLLL